MKTRKITIEDFQNLKDSIAPANEGRFSDFVSGLVTGVIVMQELQNADEQLDELMFQTELFSGELWRPDSHSNLDGLIEMLMQGFGEPK